MFLAQSHRNKFWFGTEDRMDWFPTPNRGGDFTGQSWGAGGILLNGGGYQFNSFGSHGHFVFEWPGSSSREVAQRMLSYRNGTFGRGLIYFQDPLIFDTNVLPPFWADPSMGIGQEGMSLVYGVDPTPVPTSNSSVNDLPVNSANYNLNNIPVGWRGKEEAVFIPIPEGYSLFLGAIYSRSGAGNVYYRTRMATGGLGDPVALDPVATDSPDLFNEMVEGVSGIWLYVGRGSNVASSVTLTAMSGRLLDATKKGTPSEATLRRGPWIGGQGHSGCRFVGNPTHIKNTGVDGGQVGFAATFREVGHWVHG